jgi:hypothetical protein
MESVALRNGFLSEFALLEILEKRKRGLWFESVKAMLKLVLARVILVTNSSYVSGLGVEVTVDRDGD